MCRCAEKIYLWSIFNMWPSGKTIFPSLLSGKSHGRSALGGEQGDGNQISRLNGVAGPAVSAKDARTLRFDGPANNLALGIFHIEVNLAVGIGPHEFRDAALDGDRVVGVVSGISVMRLD